MSKIEKVSDSTSGCSRILPSEILVIPRQDVDHKNHPTPPRKEGARGIRLDSRFAFRQGHRSLHNFPVGGYIDTGGDGCIETPASACDRLDELTPWMG